MPREGGEGRTVTTVRALHNMAMELAQSAMVARFQGNIQEARHYARKAFPYEAKAARHLAKNEASEPSRSILYLSAASLAYQASNYENARDLVAEGLSGYPYSETEYELRQLLDQIDVKETALKAARGEG